MANWASTSYRIEGNQKDLQELYNLCKDFSEKKRPAMEEGASDGWEGNIILALGEEIGDSYIRGFIQSFKLKNGLLSIEAEEAWGARTPLRYRQIAIQLAAYPLADRRLFYKNSPRKTQKI